MFHLHSSSFQLLHPLAICAYSKKAIEDEDATLRYKRILLLRQLLLLQMDARNEKSEPETFIHISPQQHFQQHEPINIVYILFYHFQT